MNPKDYFMQYRVYVEDTDVMGIVYHANYLYFFERARTELLRENGFNLTTMATYDTHFAIRSVAIHYLSPARLDDMLTIKTNFEFNKACGLLFKQEMYNQNEQRLCEASIHVICVDGNMKPKRINKFRLE